MAGKGRHQVLGVWSPDPVLSLVAPIGLGASVGTALVVDLASAAIRTGDRTLADLAGDGPTMGELSPGRSGLALISAGQLGPDRALEVIESVAPRWPAVVLRMDRGDWPVPVVPVIPLLPGRLSPLPPTTHGVWQPVSAPQEPPGPGPVLPRLGAGLVRRVLAGRHPGRSRWVDAWRPVWEMPWA